MGVKMNIKPFFKGFMSGMHAFTANIVTIINTILLTVVYIIGVGPISIIGRIKGKQFLDMKRKSQKNSYWETLDLKRKSKKEYYKQF